MSGVEYTIGGVKIHFPCKAYPSQLAMMNSIVRGLNSGRHCLLESPTGSGKSLALLCSALGWQRSHFEGRRTGQDQSSGNCRKSDVSSCQCVCHCKGIKATTTTSAKPEATQLVPPSPEPSKSEQKTVFAQSEKFRPSLSSICKKDDDFLPDRKRTRTAEHKGRKRQRLERGVTFLNDDPEPGDAPPAARSCSTEPSSPAAVSLSCSSLDSCSMCSCDSAKEDVDKGKDDKKRVPKIYFGTRTHKQITQISHELKRTVYAGVPMTILSSRDHTCVNPEAARHSNRNERCKELLEAKDGRSCRFYHGVHRMRDQSTLQRVHGLDRAWDVEDLVALGRRLCSCSYYAARELKQNASIVFCPYNYLLDPLIRESMEIDLAGQILVLDEAHNIEDCARESASCTLDYRSLVTCRDELEGMISSNVRPSEHGTLRDFCYTLINWIQESQSLMSDRGYEVSSKVWGGKNVLDIFHTKGITAGTFGILKRKLAAVLDKEERVAGGHGKGDTVPIATVSAATSTVLKNLFMILDYLYRDNCRFAEDYRVALQKSYAWTNQVPPDVPDAQGFIVRPHRRQRQSIRVKAEVMTLSFWCLNPAVAFSDLSGSVRSIVLTSGTLSPMGSFASELGVEFSIQLEANHVIKKSQVWVGTVGSGPRGRKLCATYQHAETFAFQDEVGALLLHVCQTVPKGVLCFLPSYKMLDKLRDRWTNTGLWVKLEEQKTVITEPRGGGKGDFDDLLQTYYGAIKSCDDRGGALLIAVCRGKVSEGLDFTDDNARAVVTVGIPFPNIKDLQVELKMKYNDQHCKSRGLLSGHRWYEVQAYRALNQALGRCIRHREDWGALVLVDERYRMNPNKYITGLSKWVRQLVQHHDTFGEAMRSLETFSQAQQKEPVGSRTPASVGGEGRGVSGNGSPPTGSTHPALEARPRKHTESFQMKQAGPARPVFSIFTFKKTGSKQGSDTKGPRPPSPVQRDSQPSRLEPTDSHVSSEARVEPGSRAVEPPAATSAHPPTEDEGEEDQSIFFTPELFPGDEDETESPLPTDSLPAALASQAPASVSEAPASVMEAPTSVSEAPASAIEAPASAIEAPASGSAIEDPAARTGETLTQEQAEGRSGRPGRLSLSRQKLPTPTGNRRGR